MGYQDNSGALKRLNPTDEELLTHFNRYLTNESHKNTTYKFALMKSILDNLFNGIYSSNHLNRFVIPFRCITEKFLESYWNLVAVNKIPQSRPAVKNKMSGELKTSKIEQIIKATLESQDISSLALPYSTFESRFVSVKTNMIKNVEQLVKKDVLGALYGDFDGLLFEFDKRTNYFALSIASYHFLLRYKTMLEVMNYYGWCKFLEEINGISGQSLLSKIENSVPERTDLSVYREIVCDEFGYHKCFYCGENLHKTDMDHFIPWMYVRENKVWNLVQSCPKCNQRIKHSALAPRTKIIEIKKRNDRIYEHRDEIHNERHKKIIVDEFELYNANNNKDGDFMTSLYDSALRSGLKTYA